MGSYETVERLLGDFFERNTAGDKEGINAVVGEIKQKLSSGEVDSDHFKDYFNNMYSGRGVVNVANIAKDYPRESIIRELLQNAFGCDYETPDIKIMIEFLDEGQVKLTYNETGFSLEQVFYYLAVGRNEGDKKREGRFGLGAKSVFTNVDWFKMRSNDYSMRVVNDDGTIKIRELQLTGDHFNHTEIVFALPEHEQSALHENLTTLTSQKGGYINMVDLCFAFLRKKNLKATDDVECVERSINIAILNYGNRENVYRITQYRKDENDIPKVRFAENGKSVADFIGAERDGFTYLIPYAISGAKREAAKVLMSKYNYFSTFELTGFMRANTQEFVDEQLSAFFVSVPNKYITNNRAGIKFEAMEECSLKIEQGILSVADDYKRLFVLEMAPRQDKPDLYMLRPRQYVFEFFYNYVNTSTIVKGLKEKFGSSISVAFPNIPEPIPFRELRQNGFFTERSGVAKEDHDSGDAMKALYQDVEQMHSWYGKDDNHVLFAKYNWNVPGTDEAGSEFLYSFHLSGNRYLIESNDKKIKDYELSAFFKSIISLKLNDFIINEAVADEDALAETFSVIDEMFGDTYRIVIKYFKFYITSGTSTIQFEISKINIGNLKKAYDTIAAHEMRFENHAEYNQAVMMLVNSFTNGKDTIQFLKEIKSQGGEVSLALDINKRYRFMVYGKQFMIPPNISNAELLDIVGDVYALIESGLFNNRVFDFTHAPGRFSFDIQDIVTTLPEAGTAEKAENIISKVYVCDLSLDKIALVNAENKLMKVVDLSAPISEEDMSKSAKLIILRDTMTKPQYAGFIEFILTGRNNNLLRGLYSGTEEPNLVLLDQLPYYYKPVPNISRGEFNYLREEIHRIARLEKAQGKHYRNFFARDVNAKLFGYGGVCPCCGYEKGILNSFTVKRFSIGLMNGEKEQKFQFALYLCLNDAAAAAGWIIDDISIGGMTPFMWLEELAEIDSIPPEYLYCRIKYRRQLNYHICEPGDSGAAAMDNVYEGPHEILDFILSPLMAAKWYEDNTSPAAVEEDAPAPRQMSARPAPARPAPKRPAPEDTDEMLPEKPAGEERPHAQQPRKPAPQKPGQQPMTPRYPAPPGVKPRRPGTEPMGGAPKKPEPAPSFGGFESSPADEPMGGSKEPAGGSRKPRPAPSFGGFESTPDDEPMGGSKEPAGGSRKPRSTPSFGGFESTPDDEPMGGSKEPAGGRKPKSSPNFGGFEMS